MRNDLNDSHLTRSSMFYPFMPSGPHLLSLPRSLQTFSISEGGREGGSDKDCACCGCGEWEDPLGLTKWVRKKGPSGFNARLVVSLSWLLPRCRGKKSTAFVYRMVKFSGKEGAVEGCCPPPTCSSAWRPSERACRLENPLCLRRNRVAWRSFWEGGTATVERLHGPAPPPLLQGFAVPPFSAG